MTQSDDYSLSPQEALDSDDVRNDDGDTVVDPPEKWIDPHEDESLDERLSAEVPDTDADTPASDTPSDDYAERPTEEVDGVYYQDRGTDRGQIDGTPEDGESFFTVVR